MDPKPLEQSNDETILDVFRWFLIRRMICRRMLLIVWTLNRLECNLDDIY